MATKKILVELFYDVLSPYSYIGFENLVRCNKSWKNMDLQLRPILIGGVMAGSRNLAPSKLAFKREYILRDLPMKSKHFGIDYKTPKDFDAVIFKNGSLKPQRLLTALKYDNHEKLEDVSRALYRRIWYKDEDINEISSMTVACLEAGVGKDETNDYVGRITLDHIKKQLKETTDEAISYSAFGAPFYVTHLESGKIPLFGCDQMYLLADMINEKWNF